MPLQLIVGGACVLLMLQDHHHRAVEATIPTIDNIGNTLASGEGKDKATAKQTPVSVPQLSRVNNELAVFGDGDFLRRAHPLVIASRREHAVCWVGYKTLSR